MVGQHLYQILTMECSDAVSLKLQMDEDRDLSLTNAIPVTSPNRKDQLTSNIILLKSSIEVEGLGPIFMDSNSSLDNYQLAIDLMKKGSYIKVGPKKPNNKREIPF